MNKSIGFFMIMDGRANFDIGRASVLECIGEAPLEKAKRIIKKDWKGYDAVLVEYDCSGNELTNPRVVTI